MEKPTTDQLEFDKNRNIEMVELLRDVSHFTMPNICMLAGVEPRNTIYNIIARVARFRKGEPTRGNPGFTTKQSDSVEIILRRLAREINEGLDKIDGV